jgi:hypothetical protein
MIIKELERSNPEWTISAFKIKTVEKHKSSDQTL